MIYTTDGKLNIDNNPVERAIRPVAIGRKNYLFAGSHEAAQRNAMLYSLLGTCKLHGVNPFDWLKDVLTRELHLARLYQQGTWTTGVGPEVHTRTVSLQRTLIQQIVALRIEPVRIQHIEDLSRNTELVVNQQAHKLCPPQIRELHRYPRQRP